MIGRCDCFMNINNNKERKYLKERNKIKEDNNKSNGVNKIKEENSIDMGLFEKRKNIVFIISLVIMSFSSFISVFAVSSYLYNSNEVSFNNSSSNSINSSNVQGAIDELYADAHNYEEMNTRVAALEGRYVDNPNIYFKGTSGYNASVITTGSDKDGGYTIEDANGKRRTYLYYHPSSDTTYLDAVDSSGSGVSGTLNLRGNVKVNGRDISNLGGYTRGTLHATFTTTANTAFTAATLTIPAAGVYFIFARTQAFSSTVVVGTNISKSDGTTLASSWGAYDRSIMTIQELSANTVLKFKVTTNSAVTFYADARNTEFDAVRLR